MAEKILEMTNISKSFMGVKVLDDVHLSVEKGQVHILLGENGAGKSTLIKILSGAYARESGTIVFDGEELPPLSPRETIQKGISVIYQEFNLLPDLPIYENIFLGKEYTRHGRVDHKREIREAAEFMKTVGLDEDPRTLVRDLSVAKRQMVEISKAISNRVKLLVLDEPTAAITDKEIEKLFEIVRKLKENGVGIIYISHRMSELFEIGDVCTIMTDGKYIDTVNIRDTNTDELTRKMVGRKVDFDRKENPWIHPDETVLTVKNVSYQHKVKDVSLDVHKGEILGISGLVGSGRTELALSILGAYKRDAGEVILQGERLGTNLAQNIRKGLVYLSEDRNEDGLTLIHSVRDNIAAPNLDKLCAPFYNRKKAKSVTQEYIRDLKIKTFSDDTEVSRLSGGNKQKVVIAKWLYADALVYIFDEPTRGIDVGAREDIYNIMYGLLEKGAAILMISSDLTEIMKMSDRIAVMNEGRIQAILDNNGDVTQEKILEYELMEKDAS